MFLAVSLYFVLICLVLWIVLFPAGQAFLLSVTQRIVIKFEGTRQRLEQQASAQSDAMSTRVLSTSQNVYAFLRKHDLVVWLCVTAVCLPPLLTLALSDRDHLDGFGDSVYEVNPQVVALLQGEELVPPVALPPEVFQTAEVVQQRPMLAGASRNWERLDHGFTQRLLAVFKLMKEQHGYDMVIIEGYRSPERQEMLAKLGGHVTNAGAYQSYHQYGLAADCAFYREGKLVISEKDPWAMKGYQLYGALAESAGLTWGGRWKMMDFGHVEWRNTTHLKPPVQ